MTKASKRTTSMRMATLPAVGSKRPALLMLAGPEAGRLHFLPEAGELIVGRDADNGLCVCDDSVSRRHAAFAVQGGLATVRDLGSKNGTFVGSSRIQDEQVLSPGDRLQLGAVTFRYSLADAIDVEFQRRMVEAALHDSLTGLHNRRYFDERVQAEISAARRFGDPLALILLDIDHFKRINDTWGHPAGDAALKLVAAELGAAVRREDTLARFGGEEFAVLLRATTIDGGLVLAERLRRRVADAAALFDGTTVRFTISAGVAVLTDGGTQASLVEAADAALYRAKRAGRNRVEVARRAA